MLNTQEITQKPKAIYKNTSSKLQMLPLQKAWMILCVSVSPVHIKDLDCNLSCCLFCDVFCSVINSTMRETLG